MKGKFGLFTLSYKREYPSILQMLKKDEHLVLHMCVRPDELANGYYDHLKDIPNLKLIGLREGLTDSGETRAAVMQYAYDNGFDFAAIFDDTISNLYDSRDEHKSISQCLFDCVERLENDPLSEYCITFQFHRKERKYTNVSDDSKYFVGMPLQCCIINVKKSFEHGINFKSGKVCGFEDAAFFIDTIKEGLITCSDTNYLVEGQLPNTKKKGGSHPEGEQIESRYDIQQEKFMKYVGNMYGVYLTKAYRKSIGELVSYGLFDYAYFKYVLVDERELNQKIIDTRFMIPV